MTKRQLALEANELKNEDCDDEDNAMRTRKRPRMRSRPMIKSRPRMRKARTTTRRRRRRKAMAHCILKSIMRSRILTGALRKDVGGEMDLFGHD